MTDEQKETLKNELDEAIGASVYPLRDESASFDVTCCANRRGFNIALWFMWKHPEVNPEIMLELGELISETQYDTLEKLDAEVNKAIAIANRANN